MNLMLTSTSTGNGGSTIMLLVMLVVIYAILIIPQRKRTKSEDKMRAETEIGDEVVTVGGIVGIVVGLKEDTITIETGADRMRLRVLRGAISRNITSEEKANAAKAAQAAAKKEKKEKKQKDSESEAK